MKYDLVFEGGGAKGMVFVGAMQVFESLGHTPGRLLGTSAGAITAALLAAGYGSPEMLDALAEKKDGRSVFSDFLGAPQELDKAAIHTSATRALLRNINLSLTLTFLKTCWTTNWWRGWPLNRACGTFFPSSSAAAGMRRIVFSPGCSGGWIPAPTTANPVATAV